MSNLWATQNVREESAQADVLVPVNAAGIAIYDMTKVRESYRRGHRAARAKITAIRNLLD